LGVGSWRLEVGDWRLEIGDWKLEVRSWRLEIGEGTNPAGCARRDRLDSGRGCKLCPEPCPERSRRSSRRVIVVFTSLRQSFDRLRMQLRAGLVAEQFLDGAAKRVIAVFEQLRGEAVAATRGVAADTLANLGGTRRRPSLSQHLCPGAGMG